MTIEYDENDTIPAGVEVSGMVDPDGNPARGRWVSDRTDFQKPRTIMVERFIESEPEVQEWDIWIEAKDGIGDAEKLNDRPLRAATFFEAVTNLQGKFRSRREFLGPKGENPGTLFHVQGGRWYKLSFDHPEDEMGRRLWPTEDQARGLRVWDVWAEGDGQQVVVAKLNGSHIVADSFDQAVQQHIGTLPDDEAASYVKDEDQNVWLLDGRKLHPTEGRARVLFG